MSAKPIIEIVNMTKLYRMGDSVVRALDGVSLRIDEGEFVSITGASGSGKSTMMHLIGCLDRPTSGSYLLAGERVDKLNDRKLAEIRNRKIGFVFQTFNLVNRTSALDNVILPMVYARRGGNTRAMAMKALERVGLAGRARHRPNELSGGERQRVAIARALLNDPAVVLADEPTGNLDSVQAEEIWKLLRKLAHELGKTVLMVTHEAAAASYADRAYVLKDGRLVGTIEEMEPGNAALVAARYTQLAG